MVEVSGAIRLPENAYGPNRWGGVLCRPEIDAIKLTTFDALVDKVFDKGNTFLMNIKKAIPLSLRRKDKPFFSTAEGISREDFESITSSPFVQGLIKAYKLGTLDINRVEYPFVPQLDRTIAYSLRGRRRISSVKINTIVKDGTDKITSTSLEIFSQGKKYRYHTQVEISLQ